MRLLISALALLITFAPEGTEAQELTVNNLSNDTVYVGLCAARDGEIKMCRYRETRALEENTYDLRIGEKFGSGFCRLWHKRMDFSAEEGDTLYFALARARGSTIRPSKPSNYKRKLWYMPYMGKRTTPPTYNNQPFRIDHYCSHSVRLADDIAMLATFHDTVIDWETYFRTGQHTFLKNGAREGFIRTIETSDDLSGVDAYFWEEAIFYEIDSGTLTFTIKP